MKISNTKRLLAAAVAAVLMLGMSLAIAEDASPLSLEDAKAIALERARFDEAAVFMTKLAEDREDGRRVFEIEFIVDGKEYEFDIDAEAGGIIKESTETVSSRKSEVVAGQLLTMSEAKEKALARVGVAADQAVFTEIEFDYDDSRAEYEMRFTVDGQTYKVELDAETGEITKHEMKSSSGKK
ncbi:MAG: PepSY domain-containing protein [Oscillospiraceae bacterium]|jgi:uncharacterized membrane protein YkoI|nr:PepSY domain-containing protein [Oscillospiraceae bacterium]